MKAFASERVLVFFTFSPCLFDTTTLSRARASLNTSTNGPFPERKTACSDLSSLCQLFAKFNPARVFPAPGTPVTKQIALELEDFASLII